MLTARYSSVSGEPGDALEQPEDLFDGVVNEAVLHQVIKAYLANQRQGNASTKTRAEVSGGNSKVWKQKGTGRARQGSTRAPHWRHGGVAFGPRPRSYHQDLPKKVKALARRSAFNKHALNDAVSVIERFDVAAPKTKQIIELLAKIGLGEQKAVRASKAEVGHAAKAGLTAAPQVLREFGLTDGEATPAVGEQVTVGIFEVGARVKVTGTTKGRGFQGVMKRHGFGGRPGSHGHRFARNPGTLGPGTNPSRVIKGKRLPGHMGDAQQTVRNLRVAKIDAERNLLYIRGAVPGPINGFVFITKQ